VKDLSKQQTLKEPKLAQLDKVLYKWFTATCSKGKPMTGLTIMEKANTFYNEMKICDKCTYSDGGNKKLPIRT
jgi:hypothetical protein